MSMLRTRRPYDATRRREQARRIHDQILAVARRRFLVEGYAVATIAGIATESGASAETIYKTFGGKSRLVKAVFDAEFAGVGPRSVHEVAKRLDHEEHDPEARLRAFGSLVAEIGPRVAPVAILIRDAGTSDPEMGRVWEQLNHDRLSRMAVHAAQLHTDGNLRQGLSVEHARDILWAYSSPELYDLLVLRQGWDCEHFGRWVGEAYISALLRPTGRCHGQLP